MRVFGHQAPVPVPHDLPLVVLPDLRDLQALHIVADSQYDVVRHEMLIHEFEAQLVHHLLHDKFSLGGAIGAVKDLSFSDTVLRRPVGLDLRDRTGLPPPGVVDQKLRVDAEKFVENIFILDGTPGDVAHCQDPYLPELAFVSAPHSPEVRDGLVAPQFLPVGPLVQLARPGIPIALRDGETARQIVFSVRLRSATTRLAVSGLSPRSLHSTDA